LSDQLLSGDYHYNLLTITAHV